MAGFLRTALALENGALPPSVHFRARNAAVPFAARPFFVNAGRREWTANGTPRLAGVSSFGISGTNAHLILQDAPAQPERTALAERPQLAVVSGKTEAALRAQCERLEAHLAAHPEQPLADVAWTLATGRSAHEQRLSLVAGTREELRAALQADLPSRAVSSIHLNERSVRAEPAPSTRVDY